MLFGIILGVGHARGGGVNDGARCAQFLNGHAAPVSRRTDRLQAHSLSALPIAQSSKVVLCYPVPIATDKAADADQCSYPVATRDRSSASYRCPDATIAIPYRLNFTKRLIKTFKIPADQHLFFYDPVVLERQGAFIKFW
jgi:hypothetical protein